MCDSTLGTIIGRFRFIDLPPLPSNDRTTQNFLGWRIAIAVEPSSSNPSTAKLAGQYDLELVVKHEEGKDQILLVPEDVLLEYPRARIVPGKKNVVKVNRTPLFRLGSTENIR